MGVIASDGDVIGQLKKKYGIGQAADGDIASQKAAIEKGASDLGIDPIDYATAMHYEQPSLNPWGSGPVTKWGQHRGTIQYGEPQQKQYGVHAGQSFEDQVTTSNVKYLKDRGVKPGANFRQIYSAINGGRADADLSTPDANTGRTIADNIRIAQEKHRPEVLKRFGWQDSGTPQPSFSYDAAMSNVLGDKPTTKAAANGFDYNSAVAELTGDKGTPGQPAPSPTFPNPQHIPMASNGKRLLSPDDVKTQFVPWDEAIQKYPQPEDGATSVTNAPRPTTEPNPVDAKQQQAVADAAFVQNNPEYAQDLAKKGITHSPQAVAQYNSQQKFYDKPTIEPPPAPQFDTEILKNPPPETQEDVDSEFEQYVANNNLPRNQATVDQFNASLKKRIDGYNSATKNLDEGLNDLGDRSLAMKAGIPYPEYKTQQDALTQEYKEGLKAGTWKDENEFNAELHRRQEAARADADKQFLEKNPKYAEFLTANNLSHSQDSIDKYNAQLPQGQTKGRIKPQAKVAANSKQDRPDPQATDADFQAANEQLATEGKPLLTREQFDAEVKSFHGKVETYLPTVGQVDGQDVAGQSYREPVQQQEIDTRNKEAVGRAYGSPIWTIPQSVKTKAEAETYIRGQLEATYPEGTFDSVHLNEKYWKPGQRISVPYQMLRDAGVDTESQIRQKVVENRVENPQTLSLKTPEEKPILNPEEQEMMAARGRAIEKMGAYGQLSSRIIGGFLGEGSDILAAIQRFTETGNSTVDSYSRGLLPTPEDLDKFSEKVRVVGENSTGDGAVMRIAGQGAEMVGKLPYFLVFTEAPAALGAGRVLSSAVGFAAESAFTHSGKPINEQINSATTSGLLGAAFGGSSKFAEWLGGKAAAKYFSPEIEKALKEGNDTGAFEGIRQEIGKIQKLTTEGATAGEREAAVKALDRKLTKYGVTLDQIESGADKSADDIAQAIKKAARVNFLVQNGTRIGIVPTLGYTTTKLQGGTDKQARDSALLFGAMELVGMATGVKPGEKFSEKDLEKVDQSLVRLPDADGKPVEVVLTREGDGLAVTKVDGMPNEAVQAEGLSNKPVAPQTKEPEGKVAKTDFIPKLTDEDVAAASKPDVSVEAPVPTVKAAVDTVAPSISAEDSPIVPATATDAAHDAAPSPLNDLPEPSHGVIGFTTAQGSTYTVDGQSTTRNKSLHKFHDATDVGMKKPSELTLYGEKDDVLPLGLGGIETPKGGKSVIRLTDNSDGTYTADQVYYNPVLKKWGKQNSGKSFTLTSTPELGKHPLELWGKEEADGEIGYTNSHAGNEITKIETAVEKSEAEPAPDLSTTKGRFEASKRKSRVQIDAKRGSVEKSSAVEAEKPTTSAERFAASKGKSVTKPEKLNKSAESFKETPEQREVVNEPKLQKTNLDHIFDKVEENGEVTVHLDRPVSREEVRRVADAAKDRGLTSAYDGHGFLIRREIKETSETESNPEPAKSEINAESKLSEPKLLEQKGDSAKVKIEKTLEREVSSVNVESKKTPERNEHPIETFIRHYDDLGGGRMDGTFFTRLAKQMTPAETRKTEDYIQNLSGDDFAEKRSHFLKDVSKTLEKRHEDVEAPKSALKPEKSPKPTPRKTSAERFAESKAGKKGEVKADQKKTVKGTGVIAVPRSAVKRYAYADEVADQIGLPEFKSAEKRSQLEKPSARTGFTKTQTEYVAKALQDYANNYPEGSAYAGKSQSEFWERSDGKISNSLKRSYREEELQPETIAVPDDGVLRITDLQQANRLHQRITGKPLKGQPIEKLSSKTVTGRPSSPSPKLDLTTTEKARVFRGLDGDSGEFEMNVPIAEVDANVIGNGKSLETDYKGKLGEGWIETKLGKDTAFTNGHLVLVTDTAPGKGKTIQSPDTSAIIKPALEGDVKEIQPDHAVANRGGQPYIVFDNGRAMVFDYYNLVKSHYPDAKFKQGFEGQPILAYNGKKLVGAIMPVGGNYEVGKTDIAEPSTKLNARIAPQSLQTDTPEFKKWFKESKVVDTDGKPLVVYHGTNQNLETFSPERRGANTNSISSKVGFYFTQSPVEATDYADMSARKQVSNAPEAEANAERLLKAIEQAELRGDFDKSEQLYSELEESEREAMTGEERGANIMPVYLQITNPLEVDFKGSVDLQKMAEKIAEAKRTGRDGLKMLNVFDPVSLRSEGHSDTTQWVAFESNQIKSAIGNNGNFDPNDPNILFHRPSAENVELLTKTLPTAHTEVVLAGIESHFTGDDLEITPHAAEMIRQIDGEAEYQNFKNQRLAKGDSIEDIDKAFDETHTDSYFGGFAASATELRNLAQTGRDRLIDFQRAGYDDADLKGYVELLDNLDNLAQKAQDFGVVYAFDEHLPEEHFHQEDLRAGRTDREAMAALRETDLWQNPGRQFLREYGDVNDADKASELAAKLATDQAEHYGWDKRPDFEKEKEAFLNTWADGIVRRNQDFIESNGIDAFIKKYERITKYAKITKNEAARGDGLEGSADARTGDTPPVRETEEAVASENGSDEESQEPDNGADRSKDAEREPSDDERIAELTGQTVEEVKTKNRQFARSLAKHLFDIGDVAYNPQTVKGWEANAEKIIEAHGVDGAIEEYRKMPAGSSEGNKTALGVAIATELYSEDRKADLTVFGKELTENIGNAAQELRASAILSRLDPAFAQITGDKVTNKAHGRPMTDEERDKTDELAKKLQEISDDHAFALAALEETGGVIDQMKTAIADAEKTLSDEQAKNRRLANRQAPLEEALKKARQSVAYYKKVVEDKRASRVYAPKTRKQLKELKEQIERDRPDLVSLIQKQFPGTALKAVVDNAPKQIETKAFQNWFAESKVVDDEGNPLVVYHATPNDFDEFKAGGDDVRKSGPAIWFDVQGEFPKAAHNIGHNSSHFREGVHVVPAYLKIVRPLVIDDSTRGWVQEVYGKDVPYLLPTAVVNQIKADGYDGIMLHSRADKAPSGHVFTPSSLSELIVFNPNQIKSAIGNNGTFDPNESSILKAAVVPDDLSIDKETLDALTQLGAAKLIDGLPNGLTVKQFDNWLDGITNNQLGPRELRTVHALAFEMTRPEGKVTSLEAKKLLRNRLDHAKRSDAILRSEQIATDKATREAARAVAKAKVKSGEAYRDDKFANAVLDMGEKIAADDATVFMAFAQRETPNPRTLQDAFKDAYPDGTTRDFTKALEAGKHLLDATKTEIDAQKWQAKAGQDATEKEVADLKRGVLEQATEERLARKALEQHFRKLEQSTAGKALGWVSSIYNLPRSIMFAGDYGFLLAQGAPLLVTHPTAWWKAVKTGIPAASETPLLNRTLRRLGVLEKSQGVSSLIRSLPGMDAALNKLGFTGDTFDQAVTKLYNEDSRKRLEGGGTKFEQIGNIADFNDDFMSDIAKHIPIVRQTNLAHSLTTDLYRLYGGEKDLQELDKMYQDGKLTAFEYNRSKEFITQKWTNVMSGKGYLGVLSPLAQPAGQGFDAPRYVVSAFQIPYYANPARAAFLPKGARSIMMKNSLKLWGSLLAIMGILSYLKVINDDPEDKDFMQIDMGKLTGGMTDMKVNPIRALKEPLRLTAGLGLKKLYYMLTGNSEGSERINKEYYAQMVTDPYGQLGAFWKSKLHPTISMGIMLKNQKNYVGEPLQWTDVAPLPLPLKEVYQAWTYDHKQAVLKTGADSGKIRDNWQRVAATAISSMIGFGANSYPASDSTTAQKQAMSMMAGGDDRNDLEKAQSQKTNQLERLIREGADVSEDIKAAIATNQITSKQAAGLAREISDDIGNFETTYGTKLTPEQKTVVMNNRRALKILDYLWGDNFKIDWKKIDASLKFATAKENTLNNRAAQAEAEAIVLEAVLRGKRVTGSGVTQKDLQEMYDERKDKMSDADRTSLKSALDQKTENSSLAARATRGGVDDVVKLWNERSPDLTTQQRFELRRKLLDKVRSSHQKHTLSPENYDAAKAILGSDLTFSRPTNVVKRELKMRGVDSLKGVR